MGTIVIPAAPFLSDLLLDSCLIRRDVDTYMKAEAGNLEQQEVQIETEMRIRIYKGHNYTRTWLVPQPGVPDCW